MQFTEQDIPLLKLLIYPETHEQAMTLGGDRAKEILKYMSHFFCLTEQEFIKRIDYIPSGILCREEFCDFFWDNNIIDTESFGRDRTCAILSCSPIAEKIWDSEKLDVSRLTGNHIYWILSDSPIRNKIWDSGKLNLSLLTIYEFEYFKQKFYK